MTAPQRSKLKSNTEYNDKIRSSEETRYKLWFYMTNEHNVFLLESEIDEIIEIINPLKYPYIA